MDSELDKERGEPKVELVDHEEVVRYVNQDS